ARAPLDGEPHEHGADGLRRGAAVGTRDPRDGERARRPRALDGPARHRLGAGRTDGAVDAQDLRGNAEELLLGPVRVDEHPALEVRRRARHAREAVAEETARAGLRDREREAALEERAAHDQLERLGVTPVAIGAERVEHGRLDAGERAGGVDALRAQAHPYLALAGHEPHGDVAGPALALAEPLGQPLLELARG